MRGDGGGEADKVVTRRGGLTGPAQEVIHVDPGEIGPVAEVVSHPRHPYTEGLMGSIPALGARVPRLRQIDGSMPRLTAIPKGCAFNPRCPKLFDRCYQERPDLLPTGTTHAACFLAREGAA